VFVETPSKFKCGGGGYAENGNESDNILLPIVVNKIKKRNVKIIIENTNTKFTCLSADKTTQVANNNETIKYKKVFPIEILEKNELILLTCKTSELFDTDDIYYIIYIFLIYFFL
jgi:hypothetical protein